MDKTKTSALAGLAALIGIGIFTRMQEPVKPLPDHNQIPVKIDPALVGNIRELKVEDLREGSGTVAKNGDIIQVRYRGSLLNGEVFDSNLKGNPFSLTLGAGSVIKGWDLGLVGMKAGGKRRLVVPAALGYGDTGTGEKIPGGATLVFEVDLLTVSRAT